MNDETQLVKSGEKVWDSKSLDRLGRKLYHGNKSLKDISNVMEHPEFQNFFKTYFTDWLSVKSIMMLMKIYEKLNDDFSDLNGYQRLALVYELMGDSDSRGKVADGISEWVKNGEELEKKLLIIEKNSKSKKLLE